MLEAIAANGELYLEATHGKRGFHWEFNPKEFVKPGGRKQKAGIVAIPPFDDDSRSREIAAELLGGNLAFYFPCRLDPLYKDPLDDPADIAWYTRNARPEWGMKNELGKSDVVPSSGRYLNDLLLYQTTFFIEIAIGRREIADFDQFATEWRRRGGDVLLNEANEMYDEIREIYAAVGAQEDPP